MTEHNMKDQFERPRQEHYEQARLMNEAAAILAEYINDCCTDGRTMKHDWFKDRMPVVKPTIARQLTVDEAVKLYNKEKEQYDIAYMRFIVKVTKLLAIRFNRLMVNVRGQGFRIAKSEEHRVIAVNGMLTSLYSCINKGQRRMRCTDLNDMEPDQAQDHRDASIALESFALSVNEQVNGIVKFLPLEPVRDVSQLH